MMLTAETQRFVELGRAWKDFVNFAQSAEAITDPETLATIKKALQTGRGRKITALRNVTQDEDGTFKGEFQQYVNPRLTKRFGFTFGENELSFTPLNRDEIEKFSEDIDEDTEEFAASKSKRAGKALNCKIEQCGGRCLRNGESCRLTAAPDQKDLWKSASGRNLATKPDTSLAKKRREMKAKRAAEKQAEVKSAEMKPSKGEKATPKENFKVSLSGEEKELADTVAKADKMSDSDLKQYLIDRNESGFSASSRVKEYRNLGDDDVDKSIKANILAPRGDARGGWKERLMYVRDIYKKDTLTDDDLQTVLSLANENGLLKSKTNAGNASRLMTARIYEKASPAQKAELKNEFEDNFPALFAN